ncbi:unnamed protein product, partial [Vitis vinifera]
MSQSSIPVASQRSGGSGNVEEGRVFINGRVAIGSTDDDFVCATLDWWPPDKCDYGTCSWGRASLLNLDLTNKILFNAIKAFSSLKIRMGGTLQDKVIYQRTGDQQPCAQFVKNSSEMFGFSEGCLPMSRWDELNQFFRDAGAVVIFGLNALSGRSIGMDGLATGAWNGSDAESLIQYTVNKGYTIHGWELGNELTGNGVGAGVPADQYASDINTLQSMVQKIYASYEAKPLVIGPGGFFDASWYTEFIDKTLKSLQVVTHHIYNLGPGVDDHLIDKILDPSYLDGGSKPFQDLQSILQNSATSATAWVGEAGGAYNSGHNLVTNAFAFSFWYLDQLGMASSYGNKTYCRQTLIGGNYGLLNTTTFVPNPDYYSALLWHRLMGRNVLSTSFNGTKKIRAYSHCSKQSPGITLLLINLDGNTTLRVQVSTENDVASQRSGGSGNVEEGSVFINGRVAIGSTDDDFICATLDWWPPDKCDYGTCSWGRASLLNLDLSNKILLNAIKAFSPLKVRMAEPFNNYWAVVIFGLNALSGRTIGLDGLAAGAWNSSDAESLIRYSANKGYTIHGWELGNELTGNGVGAGVPADQYASDINTLQSMVQKIYAGFEVKPLVLGPGGFFDASWYTEFIDKTLKSLQVVTHHIYNLGPGVDDHLIDKILDPSYLDGGSKPFQDLQSILQTSATSATAWVGEAGGAYNSGHNLVTNAFAFSFWYLDQLGMASSYDTKTYCRQTLIGGNYGLLNTTTFVPNPDYYSALLWHRLMGRNVLSTSFYGTRKIRAYAHCSKQSPGITLLLINLDDKTQRSNFSRMRRVSKIDASVREEYHLTAKDGDLHSQTLLLNGKVLTINSSRIVPPLEPIRVSSMDPVIVAPFSIVFVRFPNINYPACKYK